MKLRNGLTVVGLVMAAILVVCGLGLETGTAQDKPKAPKPQYDFEKESIPGATVDEPVLKEFSLSKAAAYIEAGNKLWWKKRKCVALSLIHI